MPYRLIASDLDGTLLSRAGTVSEENWKAIEEMGRRGVHFVPASGRCFMELPAALRDTPLIRYYITSGGGGIFDKKEKTHLKLPIPDEKCKELFDLLFRYPVCLLAHHGISSYTDAEKHNARDYASFNMNRFWVEYALEKETPVENFRAFLDSLHEIVMLVVFFRTEEDLQCCKEKLEKDPSLLVVQSDPYNLEIVSSAAGKGNALLKLVESLGIPKEETLALGDSGNDLSMLLQAGLGLAMKNAVPSVAAKADGVICSNEEHVAKYVLENYL